MSLLCKLQQGRTHPPCHSGTCDGHGSGELCGRPCECECHEYERHEYVPAPIALSRLRDWALAEVELVKANPAQSQTIRAVLHRMHTFAGKPADPKWCPNCANMASAGLGWRPAPPRSAVVYEVAGEPGTWRIRAQKQPEEPGWVGGRVLWGHDQPTEELAWAIANAWINDGQLPADNPPYPHSGLDNQGIGHVDIRGQTGTNDYGGSLATCTCDYQPGRWPHRDWCPVITGVASSRPPENFCSVCGPLDQPGAHTQPDCPRYVVYHLTGQQVGPCLRCGVDPENAENDSMWTGLPEEATCLWTGPPETEPQEHNCAPGECPGHDW
jgi:hypothetical protein